MDKIIIGNYELPTLIALTEEEQKMGLMGRTWPPPIMAFPYNSARIRKFWMKNTISPLDIIFCRAGTVLSIINGEPLSLNHVGPDEPSDLVIELPKGMAKKLGVTVGTKTKLVYGLFTLARSYEMKLSKKY